MAKKFVFFFEKLLLCIIKHGRKIPRDRKRLRAEFSRLTNGKDIPRLIN